MKTWLFGGLVLMAGLSGGCGDAPVPPPAAAAPTPEPAPVAVAVKSGVEDTAAKYFAVWSKGDCAAMQAFYAPKVTLLAGSELLKAEWGINQADDRSQSLEMESKKLLEGYGTMIAKIGLPRWQEAFGKLRFDSVSFHAPTEYPELFPGAEKTDVLMLVPLGHGDDTACFVWRPGAAGTWSIVMELTDY